MAFTRGPELLLEAVNEPMLRLLAQPTAAAVLGQHLAQVLPAVEARALLRIAQAVIETGQAFGGSEVPLNLRTHSTLQPGFFNVSCTPLVEQGQVTGLVHVVIDVTEQVLARQQVQQLNQELAAANVQLLAANHQLTRTNVDLDNFIYTASHDLRAPIANIEGLLQLVQDLLPAAVQADAQLSHVFGLMQEAVARFTRTIAQLTDLTKLQVEFAEPAGCSRLAAVVEEVRQDLLPLLQQTGGQLEVAVAPDQMLRLSEKNLRSIVYNLLSNALKYRHPARPPVVRLSCGQAGGQVHLQVQDNGLGMSEAQQTLLFGLFQRLHTHVEGTGVGLYMVKRIVENAGGTLRVESQLEQGTTFTLSLPA